jgi:hypothetical protein
MRNSIAIKNAVAVRYPFPGLSCFNCYVNEVYNTSENNFLVFKLSFCISRLCMGRYSPSLSVCYELSAPALLTSSLD